MNVKRFVGKNVREAMAQVRAAWGDDAVVLSNRPTAGGVEILALPASEPLLAASAAGEAAAQRRPLLPPEPMSTVSFERFVRERQRQELALMAPETAVGADAREDTALDAAKLPHAAAIPTAQRQAPIEPGRFAANELRRELLGGAAADEEAAAAAPGPAVAIQGAAAYVETRDTTQEPAEALMAELRNMRGMISAQLAGLAWFDTVRRSPGQTRMLRLLLGNGFSPALARQLVGHLPDDLDEDDSVQWMSDVLARNLRCAGEDAIAERGGVFALVGPTGVGKTTTTAKIAARFAMRHGAASVGLITVDTYRMAASDQLRAFGRILNIPVHTARDAASLSDLLTLFEKKKLVLIDTAGMGQRDRRKSELFDALPADRVSRLLVLNASAQAETLEEVVQAYAPQPGTRCVISKLDEAVKTGAVTDVVIRRKLVVEGIASGQRVPEDWHAARPQLLARKSLMKQPESIFTPDDAELGLLATNVSRARTGDLAVRHA
jgi:flagellar biosynthesis protein FlhF